MMPDPSDGNTSPSQDAKSDYPEILTDLRRLIQQRLTDKLPPAVASELAYDLAEDVRLKWGGGLIYIPKGASYDRKRRDTEIWQSFSGHNQLDLARRYNLTLSQIYDILARERAYRQSEPIFRPPE